MKPFEKPFTRQEPIPEAGIAAAVALMRSGRLHRYEAGREGAAAELERRYAAWQGARFCLAVASGGQSLQIALRTLGVRPGERVLTNAWTLAPVPGAVACVGAEAVLVETTEDLVIDAGDLAAKAEASGARVLLLSHMRGHLVDMDALMAWAAGAGVAVIEDCAHTMGAEWRGHRSGTFGAAACFSTQTYKHLNSGEGGLLTTDDPGIAARATVLSGSYMLFDRHGAGPDPTAFADASLDCPNGSARMDELRAAILLPQIEALDANLARWERRHAIVAHAPRGRTGPRPAPAALRRAAHRLLDPVPPAAPRRGPVPGLREGLRRLGRDGEVVRRPAIGLHLHARRLALPPAPGPAPHRADPRDPLRHAPAADLLRGGLPPPERRPRRSRAASVGAHDGDGRMRRVGWRGAAEAGLGAAPAPPAGTGRSEA